MNTGTTSCAELHSVPWSTGTGTSATYRVVWITYRVDGVVTHLHRWRPVRRCTRHGIA